LENFRNSDRLCPSLKEFGNFPLKRRRKNFPSNYQKLLQNLLKNNENSFKCIKNIGIIYIARSNEILGWEDVGNRQLLCFFKA
jgi:hypothetical protein